MFITKIGTEMKSLFRAAVILVLLSTVIISQPLSTSFQVIKKPAVLSDFRAFSKAGNTIFAANYDLGVRSNVNKSTDGGLTWQMLSSAFPASDNLNAIFFITEQIGFVGGSNGVIYKTTDGGTNWVSVTSPSYAGGINFFHFFNATTGFVGGSADTGGNLLKTTDGGTTWAYVTNPIPTRTLYDILWLNQAEGIVVGSGSQYMFTTDGGATWTAGTMPGASTTLYRIRQADANTFYVVGTAGRAYKSTDGGATFVAVTTPTTSALYSAEFYDANNGVLLGSNGIVLRTTNGGTNWTFAPVFSTEVIRASLKDGNRILSGGYKANLGISTDAGATWNTIGSTSRDFYGVYAENTQKYTVVGDRGELHQTTDGGLTWRKSAFMVGDFLYDAYTSGNLIYTCGRLGAFFVSTDNGNSWINRTNGSSTTRNYKLNFFDNNTGYMVNNEGGIMYTTNQGVNWTANTTVPLTTFYDIKMVNPTTGYAVGSGDRLFKTTDGVNFSHGTMAVPAGQVTGVAMIDANTGYICGENGAFYKTTDGFQTVTLLSDTLALQGKVMHDIVIFGENDVWAFGRQGVVMRRLFNTTYVDTTFGNIDFLAAQKISNTEMIVAASNGLVFKVSREIVPVELVSFTAEASNGVVTLNWSTATETNNKGFSIERKTSNTWESIAFVDGKGTTTSPVSYTFNDRNVTESKAVYRLKQVDHDGTFAFSDEVEVDLGAMTYSLEQNYPNPFNPSTSISFTIPLKGNVSLEVFDMTGAKVASLVNGELEAGRHQVTFDASALSSGVYLYKLVSGNFVSAKKLTLLK